MEITNNQQKRNSSSHPTHTACLRSHTVMCASATRRRQPPALDHPSSTPLSSLWCWDPTRRLGPSHAHCCDLLWLPRLPPTTAPLLKIPLCSARRSSAAFDRTLRA
ncbi:hypothetical protein PtA15_4A650 [Puccinia triticina]|uniref:Uncharacterized protein n=1 Tax=Puccinia triticina TaxID=208348 RepID=A0ABY7CH06_9BASI|nr:uncharacterized protein PtA15_4A650 [Puccinia triticina]WAQ84198.1 hypothetical protein PtA15_4A650 [Puccinia triticina]